MTVKSKAYYWAECDHEGCDDRNPDGEEYSAWEDASSLFGDTEEETAWTKTDDGRTWCPKHWPSREECSSCGGDGWVKTDRPLPSAPHLMARDLCAECDGNGWVERQSQGKDAEAGL